MNQTYLFFDGKEYKEYGPAEISEQEYLEFDDAFLNKKMIESMNMDDDTDHIEFLYYIRKNGILQIQCREYKDCIENYYYTFTYEDNKITSDLGESNNGLVKEALSTLPVEY